MRKNLALPVAGVLLAIAITAVMDATGLTVFSALPLAPLLAIFWYLDGLSRRDAGFVLARARDYLPAVAYPLIVMGLIAAIAAAAGALDPSRADWSKALANIGLVAFSTWLAVMITEEGFFRGWLWGALERRGYGPTSVLVATSLAFAAWHISPIVLPTGFDVPAAQVPVFLANATLLGAIWGVLRRHSGSVVVASVSHGLWNGLAYVLFGFGTHAGALGLRDTALWGPEVGLAGLALNFLFLLALLVWWRPKSRP